MIYQALKKKECDYSSNEYANRIREIRQLRIDKLYNELLKEYKNKLIMQEELENKRLKYEKLRKSECNHYAISSDFIIDTKELYDIINNIISDDWYNIKEIKKDAGDYFRLSINKAVDDKTIEYTLIGIRVRTNRCINKLKIKENKDIKIIKKLNVEDTTIVSLNINKIKNKAEELNYYLNVYRPTVICLQETGNILDSNNTHLSGYRTLEVKRQNGGLGLIIGIRKDCEIISKIIEKNDFFLLMMIKNKDVKLYVLNIYVKANGSLRKNIYCEYI